MRIEDFCVSDDIQPFIHRFESASLILGGLSVVPISLICNLV